VNVGRLPAGVQAIIAYKFAKGAFSASVGLLSLVLLHTGAEAAAATLAQQLLDHSTDQWAIKGATLIVLVGTRSHAILAAVAGFADAAVSLLEAAALRRGAWWGPWLVVIATGALLPLELIALIHRTSPVRVAIFLINLLAVGYLLRVALRGVIGSRARARTAKQAFSDQR
jgi:uncharacterized membrane protein (DUF2068 family)